MALVCGGGGQGVAKHRGVTWEWLRCEARWHRQPRVKEDPEGPCSVASPFSLHHDPAGRPRADLVEGPFSHHPLISDGPAGLWIEGLSMTCGCPFASMWLPTLSFLVATNRDFEYRG